jgi:hypothetical protein
MRVASGLIVARLVGVGVLALVLGCGSDGTGSDDPDTVVWISFQTNLSSVAVDIEVTSQYNTQTFPMPPGGNSQTNQMIGEVGDLLSFKVTGPGGTTTVGCQASSLIVGGSSNPPHSVFGELNVDADNASTVAACGNNWQ